ncbi:hypothetical protein I7I51_00532 [Histoplasma capsulatum]|uniref:Uncharacterized protein n=1 Tax=Ajellomyces capsulatus TaxID=5037 RepID=A0A8A1MFT0_AJECA|nr:hypothetical protein I7I51_00532 [Histoplasma capsulatum]
MTSNGVKLRKLRCSEKHIHHSLPMRNTITFAVIIEKLRHRHLISKVLLESIRVLRIRGATCDIAGYFLRLHTRFIGPVSVYSADINAVRVYYISPVLGQFTMFNLHATLHSAVLMSVDDQFLPNPT